MGLAMEFALRLRVALFLAKQPAEVVMRVRVARIERDGAAEVFLGGAVVAQAHQDETAQVVRLCEG
jgi:hypothetical protein